MFRALAHPVRRHVMQVLHARGGSVRVGELAARFQHSWPTTSRHLRVLEAASLLTTEAVGRERRVTLQHKHLHAMLDLWSSSVGLRVEDAGLS